MGDLMSDPAMMVFVERAIIGLVTGFFMILGVMILAYAAMHLIGGHK